MPVPLDHLKGSAGYIFPVGLEPWHLTEFLESGLSLLASDRRSISRRGESEGELGHCTDEKTRVNERKIERCVAGLGWKGGEDVAIKLLFIWWSISGLQTEHRQQDKGHPARVVMSCRVA